MTRPVAVILGAGMGGSGVARSLAPTHDVVIVDRGGSKATALADAVGGVAATADLLDIDSVTGLQEHLVDRFGRVDAVIHLVGGWQGSPSVDRDALVAWDAIAPGVFGTLRVTSVVFRESLLASGGTYVMVSSTAAHRPTAGNVAYATAKAAAESWLGGLADSFAESSARAVIVAVKALVTANMRAADPNRKFPGYTDVDALGEAIKGILEGDTIANGARVDLTKE
jgi:NAD(P)-dependent dehydrogenase (short-subunit alcohol dehydrogenase family)